MKNIIIWGDTEDRILTDAIINTCEKYGGVSVFDGQRLYCSCDDPEFSICCPKCLREIGVENAVVIIGYSAEKPDDVKWNDDCICIIDSTDERSVYCAEGCKNVIGCSMSERDTIGICGCTDELNPMISLKRALRVGKRLIEPCDFIFPLANFMPVFPLLASSVVVLVDK